MQSNQDEGQAPLVPASRLHEIAELREKLHKARMRRADLKQWSSRIGVGVHNVGQTIVYPEMFEAEEAKIFTATISSIADTHLERLEQQIVDRLKRLQIDPDV